MRIVIDTNVVASGILFGGKPERILELAIKNDVEMCVSPQILAERKFVSRAKPCDLSLSKPMFFARKLANVFNRDFRPKTPHLFQ